MTTVISDEAHPLDYDQVTPTVYVGSNSCCWGHFNGELLAKGIRGDISLEEERLDHPEGIDFFLWLPTKDHAAPSRDHVELGVQTLLYCRDHDIPCYVHCKNGHGRAPTLVAAFLMRAEGISAESAVARLKAARPAVHFQEAQVALLKSLA
ncbi:MAG: hypothetical protein RL141_980 [Candidatus Parcubacteria bacterium]|jgi:hypothetical protein